MKEIKPCIHCGANPVVSHRVYWYFESLNIFFAPLRRFLLHNFFSRFIKNVSSHINLTYQLVNLGRFLKIISLQNDLNKCKVPRAKVLWQEAFKRHIIMQELLLFNRPFDVYVARRKEMPNTKYQITNKIQIPKKSKIKNQKSTIVFGGLPRPKNYEDSALEWMDDKWLFKKKLMERNLPVPKGGSAWNFGQALRVYQDIQNNTPPSSPPILGGESRRAVVVKPRAGSRGRHSTTFVFTLADLRAAFKIAKQLCFWAVVEQQLEGSVYRATLINFELCGVLRGDPPQVRGDGVHTIRELIHIKNNRPHEGVHPVKSREAGTAEQSFNRVKGIVVDEAMERFLERGLRAKGIGFRPWDFVPALDETINLSEKIGVNYGGSSSEDYEICHEDNRQLFVTVAKVIGDPVVGFDFIVPDITKSWKEQNCGFIEANSLPFINLHHDPLHGQARDVAAKVWDMMGW